MTLYPRVITPGYPDFTVVDEFVTTATSKSILKVSNVTSLQQLAESYVVTFFLDVGKVKLTIHLQVPDASDILDYFYSYDSEATVIEDVTQQISGIEQLSMMPDTITMKEENPFQLECKTEFANSPEESGIELWWEMLDTTAPDSKKKSLENFNNWVRSPKTKDGMAFAATFKNLTSGKWMLSSTANITPKPSTLRHNAIYYCELRTVGSYYALLVQTGVPVADDKSRSLFNGNEPFMFNIDSDIGWEEEKESTPPEKYIKTLDIGETVGLSIEVYSGPLAEVSLYRPDGVRLTQGDNVGVLEVGNSGTFGHYMRKTFTLRNLGLSGAGEYTVEVSVPEYGILATRKTVKVVVGPSICVRATSGQARVNPGEQAKYTCEVIGYPLAGGEFETTYTDKFQYRSDQSRLGEGYNVNITRTNNLIRADVVISSDVMETIDNRQHYCHFKNFITRTENRVRVKKQDGGWWSMEDVQLTGFVPEWRAECDKMFDSLS
ncbi:unnamed protein product [Owenia fusiformis]|uniref:Uncharacterized protein n=1 Tax=Owenia fusiformis TaxID=6347 RepID=A0A8S4Q7P3_OWEFU|nr:unnamed protein product [Owenia fusiformis]